MIFLMLTAYCVISLVIDEGVIDLLYGQAIKVAHPLVAVLSVYGLFVMLGVAVFYCAVLVKRRMRFTEEVFLNGMSRTLYYAIPAETAWLVMKSVDVYYSFGLTELQHALPGIFAIGISEAIFFTCVWLSIRHQRSLAYVIA